MIKFSAIGAAIVLILTSAVYLNPQRTVEEKSIKKNAGKGFAVLELFTSEGCSSCPPADELIEQIQQEYADKPVYVLAYHVNYWDRQGWRDVFSAPAFTKRQYWYHQKFSTQVYTPQLIVNGTREFVGSDERAIRNTLTHVLSPQATTTTFNLQGKVQNGKLAISYQVAAPQSPAQLLVAIVQKHAISRVKAGENEGRTLFHAQIVRSLSSYQIKPEGAALIDIPAGFDKRNWEVIGMIQNSETGEILEAMGASL